MIKMVRYNGHKGDEKMNDTPRSQQLVLRENTRFIAEDGDLAISVPSCLVLNA